MKGVEKNLQGTRAIKLEKHFDNLKFSWLMPRGQLENVLKSENNLKDLNNV